ncbi:ABC-2 transporter permease [Facklamia miroungae]|uniref:ABC-2 family transporter protein n=1 Tax=Facklamia miroungae TaxID=120956 RepID=A0A1G7QJ06_9LACT|nr:ABC-2 transporter permease [Facklamia miroungae]NKZ28959.1 hypothetical protein [Facklamia miroungae]SDF98504.1 ABC-2 family transporter protein [Facklamia miroungae]
MKAVLYREFLVNKQKDMLYILILIVLLIIFLSSQQIEYLSFILSLIIIQYPGLKASGYNQKKAEVLLNSLPMGQNKIVLAKYLHAIWFDTLCVIIISLYSNILTQFKAFTLNEILLTEFIFFLSLSIAYPINWFKEKMLTGYFYLVNFFAIVYIYFNRKSGDDLFMKWKEIVNHFMLSKLIIIGTIISVIFLTASYFISVHIYKRKDF